MNILLLVLQLLDAIAQQQNNPAYKLAIDAQATLQKLYNDLRADLQQASELTPEQVAKVDAKAEAVFASDAGNPDKN